MVPVRMAGPWVSRRRAISWPRFAARERSFGVTWRTKSWVACDMLRRNISAPPSISWDRALESVCLGPRVAMSLVRRACGNFQLKEFESELGDMRKE